MRIPRLLAICDPAAAPGPEWRRWCEALGAAGVDGLQVRRKACADRDLLALAGAAREASPGPRTLLVNARPDIALAARADGVQLPASGLPVAAVRRAFGTTLLIGRSTHSVDEVRRARDQGADFVIFGPVFETPSKAGWIPARGISSLSAAVTCGLPVLAIGGIDQSNAQSIVDSGAWGLAAIRWFQDPAAGQPAFAALLRSWGES